MKASFLNTLIISSGTVVGLAGCGDNSPQTTWAHVAQVEIGNHVQHDGSEKYTMLSFKSQVPMTLGQNDVGGFEFKKLRLNPEAKPGDQYGYQIAVPDSQVKQVLNAFYKPIPGRQR